MYKSVVKQVAKSSLVFLFILFMLAGLSSAAQARTLFIDFNNAESEINVFRKHQLGGAKDVVVIPSYSRISQKKRLHIVKVNETIEKYTIALQDCAVAIKKDKKCESFYYDQIYSLEKEREKTTGFYTADDLKAELQELMDEQRQDPKVIPFNMVVISGHHELGFYRGELTDAKVKEFIDMMQASRQLYANVNTVVFLGCETGTRDLYQNTLINMFPKVPVILASEDNAPTRNEARNLAYIKQVIQIRPQLLAAKTVKDVQPLYQSLLDKHWPASILWRQNVMFFKDSTELL